MKKGSNIVCNILAVLGYFYGVALIATLILMPIGIYSIIAAHRFSAYADMSGVELSMHKNSLVGWVIFACILYFPIGLISLIVYKGVSNDVYVTNVAAEKQTPETPSEPTEVEIDLPKSEEEKKEKLEKLERFKQNGLITEEEFNQAKSQLEEDKK